MFAKVFVQIIIVLVASLILSGCMQTLLITGTTNAVFEISKDRKFTETVSDKKISTSINTIFFSKNFHSLYTQVTIEVIKGKVLLTGSVQTEEDMMNAVQIAWGRQGVSEVINELIVDPRSNDFNFIQYLKDSIITGRIKLKIMLNKIKFTNYTIITNNNIVYIFGLAKSKKELKQVAEIASKINGVLKVVSHARLNINYLKSQSNPKKSNDKDLLIDTDIDYLNLKKEIINDW